MWTMMPTALGLPSLQVVAAFRNAIIQAIQAGSCEQANTSALPLHHDGEA